MKLINYIEEVENIKTELQNEFWQFINSRVLYKNNDISGESITMVEIVTDDMIPDYKVVGLKGNGKEFIDNFIDEIEEKDRAGEKYSIENLQNVLIEKNAGVLDEWDSNAIIKLMKLYNREIGEISDSV